MKTQYRNYDEIDLDILDTHIQAMTAEKLHGKAEIARELAWRDEQINALRGFVVKTYNEFNETGTISTKTCLQGATLMVETK